MLWRGSSESHVLKYSTLQHSNFAVFFLCIRMVVALPQPHVKMGMGIVIIVVNAYQDGVELITVF